MKKSLTFLLRTILILFLLANIVTAFHAYKFTHFYDAGNTTYKRPADKGRWDITKDILFGINAVKRPDNIAADSNFQTVRLLTNDKTNIETWFFKTDAPAKGTVILFHGHGGTRLGVMTEAALFRKMGYHTLLVAFRAHGSSGGNTCTIGYAEAEEVKLAYEFIEGKGEQNIILWGISMGAAAITKAVNDYELKPSKIILEMPFGSVLEAAEGRIKLMGLPPEPLATFITFWGGTEHGFWAFGMKPSVYAKKIQSPVLLQWGRKDTRVSESETNLIYQNLPASKKLVVYETCGHESLCKKENQQWLSEVQQFLAN